MTFPYYQQPDQMDCGPTCLRMVAKHFGRSFKLQTLRQLCEINIMSKFNKLSRAEMKNVLGGQEEVGGGGTGCYTGSSCSVFDGTDTHYGTCSGDLYTICECVSDYGPYNASHYSCQF